MGLVGYAAALLALALPTGQLRDRIGQNYRALIRGCATTFERFHERVDQLVLEYDPRRTTELINEWEESVGLPDECTAAATTLQARRAEVVARLISVGGASIAYLQSIAQAAGYTVTIEEVAPAHIRIHSSASASIQYFLSGVSHSGDRLIETTNQQLECVLGRVLHAHLVVEYAKDPDLCTASTHPAPRPTTDSAMAIRPESRFPLLLTRTG